jgi:hypothetical protein
MGLGAKNPVDVDAGAAANGEPPPKGAARLLPPAVMMLVLTVAAVLPLFRNHIFYLWDDTAGAGLPNWLQMAESVSDGRVPLLQLDMWRGGNFAGEGVGGVWNPVILLAALGTYAIDNMAIAIAIAKTGFMLIMAGGLYLLARNYKVRPTLAATLGTMVPLSGYSFFVDTSTWLNALILTAFTPWLWWAARRALHNGGSYIWVVVAGYLACSLGNPYGLLSTGFVMLGVLVEAWVTGRRNRITGLVLSGVAVLLLNVLIYLPLLATASVGYRANSTTYNDEFLSPNLTDFLLASTPSAQPFVNTFGLPFMTVPGMFLAFFVLPLLPWLRWRTLTTQWRPLAGLLVFGGAYVLLTLGPSQVWMFRWPLRLIDFVWLAVALLFVILANAGLHRDRFRQRLTTSAVIVAAGAYLAWADIPEQLDRHVFGALIVFALVVLVVRFNVVTKAGYAVLMVGTLLVFAMQVLWFPGFYNVINYQFPNSRAELHERFDKYEGLVVQIADLNLVGPKDLVPDRAYKDMLFGNMYAVAGVESTTAYSGIGFTKFDSLMCARYQGSLACPEVWDRLWERPKGYSAPLADLMRVETVVVQNKLLDLRGEEAPDGWRRATEDEDSGLATVWERITPLPNPDGRLSAVTGDTDITADRMTSSTGESISFRRDDASDPARLTFARLAWPGYTATLDGRTLTTRSGPAGLLEVELPRGVTSGEVELTFTPPGMTAAVGAYGLGLVLTVGLGVVPWFLRRRNRPASQVPDLDDLGPAPQHDPDNTPAPVGSGSGTEGGVRQ